MKVPIGAKPTGALIDGRIYLFADNLRSAGDVYVTLFHEVFHLGLQRVLPAEDYAAVLGQFARNLLVTRDVSKWREPPRRWDVEVGRFIAYPGGANRERSSG